MSREFTKLYTIFDYFILFHSLVPASSQWSGIQKCSLGPGDKGGTIMTSVLGIIACTKSILAINEHPMLMYDNYKIYFQPPYVDACLDNIKGI